MRIRTVERASYCHFGEERDNRIIDIRRGRTVVPHALAKRLDGQISIWLSDYVSKLRHPKADLSGLIAAANPNFPGFSYLPGRRPLIKADKELIDGSVALRLKQMQRYGLLTEEFDPLYQEAAEIVFSFAVDTKLPLLSVERAIGRLFDGIIPEETGLDPFHQEKRLSRAGIMSFYQNITEHLAKDKTANRALYAVLDLALRANNLCIINNEAYTQALASEHLMRYIGQLWHGPINYYRNDLGRVFPHYGGQPKKIAYVLEHAGESIIDLMAISYLKAKGHQVSVIACSAPALNNETAVELKTFITDCTKTGELKAFKEGDVSENRSLSEGVYILDGSPVPGTDLTNISTTAKDAFSWADLWVLKGEGNLLGFPPECRFGRDILHLWIAKNRQFNEGLGLFVDQTADPQPGDAVAWFRPAA
jgi:uncharacterized protein with ATP-grasp and redox domains